MAAAVAAHTILVVDDEPASVRTVERALQDEARVVSATTAAQGLAALAAEPVALIIVDQRMPEMTGTELLAHTAVQHPDVIRILLTGYTGIETLVDAINTGHVYYYLTKPWEPQALRLVVRRGLERYDAEADRRRLLAALEQAYARARHEADQKTRLLAVASHELGTPLHILSNALEFMSETDLPPAARPWLETARRNALWLARGLAQMATAARSGPRALKLRRMPLDLRPVLDSLQSSFAPILATRGLVVRFDIAAALPAITADRMWLQRALHNLISNAVRFTPDGGSIRVAAGVTAGAVEISVTDTGIGIDESLHAVVFEPLSAAAGDLQLHTSGRFEFGSRGLGLGLAIAKAIIEQHGGAVAVRSQPGIGSRFTVTLPL